ncbi:thiamin-monophosphate kinase [Moraxella macacae 0408225]|uniref:Thiamine-monophosphate kinase n=1 Tax=Moraxella macacae 0408225 TaxID=1230338 RepID=L2F954_9GAMM|nr:thiamine-phosphate kinase [Moraxella macacae]ELA09574.1 thiamin-monophosphate kinase [Moraxella macacae 0408225]
MSEFSLIYRHFKNLTTKHKSTVIGIGDDGAVNQIAPNHELVSCVDVLVAGRHFLYDTMPHAIGYKAVAVNLSDLASMGACPFGILLGLSLPKNLANDGFISKFAQGIADICREFGVDLIGGDTTQSPVLTISITALGTIPKGLAIKRSGAKAGDVICVSGAIGSASFALNQRLQGKNCTLQTALDYPKPQVALGQKLIGFANSMMDISDGLGQDLGHILTASSSLQKPLGARIDLDKIPINPLLNHLPNSDKWQHIVNGGDDYELLLTMTDENFKQFDTIFPNTLYPIGKIIDGSELRFFYQNKHTKINIQGWEHF